MLRNGGCEVGSEADDEDPMASLGYPVVLGANNEVSVRVYSVRTVCRRGKCKEAVCPCGTTGVCEGAENFREDTAAAHSGGKNAFHVFHHKGGRPEPAQSLRVLPVKRRAGVVFQSLFGEVSVPGPSYERVQLTGRAAQQHRSIPVLLPNLPDPPFQRRRSIRCAQLKASCDLTRGAPLMGVQILPVGLLGLPVEEVVVGLRGLAVELPEEPAECQSAVRRSLLLYGEETPVESAPVGSTARRETFTQAAGAREEVNDCERSGHGRWRTLWTLGPDRA